MASLSVKTIPTPHPSLPRHPTIQNPHKSAQTHFTNSSSDAEIDRRVTYKSYFANVSALCKDGRIQEAVDLVTKMELGDVRSGPEVYGELLQGCVRERALSTGRQVHARIAKNGEFFAKSEYIETKLLIFYAKCDVVDAADVLFCRLRVQNVFSWAAILGLRCRVGLCEEALTGYWEMQENGVLPDNFVVPNALKACGTLTWVGFGKGVHGYVEKMGLGGCVFVASSLIDFYGKCGLLEDARKVFDSMPERNAVAWNSIIVGYVKNGRNDEAIHVFYDMRVEGIEPTRVTVSSFLSASTNIGAIEEGMQGHAISVLAGLELDDILGTSIVNFYAKSGLMEDAELVFDRMVERDVVTWNLLISGYVQNGHVERALETCNEMKLEHLRFDSVTVASLLSASAKRQDLRLGKEAHGYCIRNNLGDDVVVSSSIMEMYSACDRIEPARDVFDFTRRRDLIMWNTLIAAYADLGASGEALKLFYQMQLQGLLPNLISWNSLILGFLRNGQVNEAKNFFSQMQSHGVQPNLLTWTTLISGLAQNGLGDEAVHMFQQMQEAGIRPNIVCIVCVLSACRDVASLRLVRAIHAYVLRHNLSSSCEITTSLTDMYAKCGNAEEAERFFSTILIKDTAIYNAMISGHALHGRAHEALALYKHLKDNGLEPDSITFTNVLTACNHSGLVNEAMDVFNDMFSNYHMKPSIEHYGCVVNLLCRCGYLEEAFDLSHTMPYEPDARILGSLLAGCREHGEIELKEYLSKELQELETENSGNYVALSNSYAMMGKWDEVSKLRGIMKSKGLRKTPGTSWIQVGGDVRLFLAGDRSHAETGEIYTVLALLDAEMRSAQSCKHPMIHEGEPP
ncbi:uncharacterized protein J3R85_012425 [Psidium guajava]|nr:uncharacterized protein J3R85_012425 [Psidium guajava]